MVSSPSGSPKPLREQARETVRSAILAAAQRRFGQQGYQATKMAQIARDAGVAAGTLYNYFDSKEAVFDEIVRIQGEEIFDAMEADIAASSSPLQALHVLVSSLLQTVQQHRQMYSVLVEVQVNQHGTGRQTSPGTAADTLRLRFGEIAARVIENANAAGLLGQEHQRDLLSALLGLCNGFLSDWVQSGQNYEISSKAPIITRIFLDGVRHRDHA